MKGGEKQRRRRWDCQDSGVGEAEREGQRQHGVDFGMEEPARGFSIRKDDIEQPPSVQSKLMEMANYPAGTPNHQREATARPSYQSDDGDTKFRTPDSTWSNTKVTKRKFQEERPHQRWIKKYDIPLPQELVDRCLEQECQICGVQITSVTICQQHYEGIKHGKKVALELEEMFRDRPDEPKPKRLKSGLTPTVTCQTENFLADLAGSMDVPLTPRQVEQMELWEPPLPADILTKIKEGNCEVCDLAFSSESQAASHYQGKPHEKKVTKALGLLTGGTPQHLPKKKVAKLATTPAKSAQVSTKSRPRCSLCKVDFSGPACATSHYAGTKHQKKLAQAVADGVSWVEGDQEVDSSFGGTTAFARLSEADKERLGKANNNSMFAMLQEGQAESNGKAPKKARASTTTQWAGLTEEDASLYKEAEPYYCSQCDINCQTEVPYQMHMQGKTHLRKVKKQEEAPPQEGLHCDVCNVQCNSAPMFEAHILSKKHQAKSKKNGVVTGSAVCDVCKITCSNETALQDHMKGKPHAKMLKKLGVAEMETESQAAQG